MDISLTTPALLFPAISLLMLAYTNRFIVLAQLARDLHERYTSSGDNNLLHQIKNLKKRIGIIKNMQILGATSFFACVVCMFLIFLNFIIAADIVFALSLLLLLGSLGLMIQELLLSIKALDIQLSDIDE